MQKNQNIKEYIFFKFISSPIFCIFFLHFKIFFLTTCPFSAFFNNFFDNLPHLTVFYTSANLSYLTVYNWKYNTTGAMTNICQSIKQKINGSSNMKFTQIRKIERFGKNFYKIQTIEIFLLITQLFSKFNGQPFLGYFLGQGSLCLIINNTIIWI